MSWTRNFSHRLYNTIRILAPHIPRQICTTIFPLKSCLCSHIKIFWPVVVAHKIWYCSDYILSKFYMTLLLPLCRYVVHSHTQQTWYNVTTIWYHELIEGKGNFCCLLIGRICVLKTLRSGIMPWYKTILEFVWWLLLIRKAFNIKRRRGLGFYLMICEEVSFSCCLTIDWFSLTLREMS